MDGQRLLEDLAREHAAHLRWLGARYPAKLTPEALEEVLQDAYAKAMTALGREPAPTFRTYDDARGWFRRIADRTAIDALRARDGRRPGSRPQVVELTEDAPLVADDLEESMLGAAERDHRVHVIARAIRELPDHYQRVLRWRYGRALEPEAIARLERINARQYEGRHYRAIAALRQAVAELELGAGCGEVRRSMRRRRGGVLDPSAGRARAHVESCTPCRAFERTLRGALGLVPLSPTAVALELVGRPAPAATPSAPPNAHGVPWPKALAGGLAGTVAAAGAAVGLAGGTPAPTTPAAESGAQVRLADAPYAHARHSVKLYLGARANSTRPASR